MNPLRALFLSLSRMPPVLMLFIILGLAVVVTMYVTNVIAQKDKELVDIHQLNDLHQREKTKVVYASKNIEEGEIIAAEAIEERDVAAARAPVDAFSSINAVVGQQAAYPIVAGTILSTHATKPFAMQVGFNGKIREGMRAVTFGVDTNSGVAGFVAPGNRVDVLGITGSADTTKAAPVMSDVEVIAVGTTYQKAPGSSVANPAGSVTVAVTPEDSIKLVKAVSAAKLYLTLRNDKDHWPIPVVDVANLFPKSASGLKIADAGLGNLLPPPQLPTINAESGSGGTSGPIVAPAPPAHEIEMWSGSRKEVMSVPQT